MENNNNTSLSSSALQNWLTMKVPASYAVIQCDC